MSWTPKAAVLMVLFHVAAASGQSVAEFEARERAMNAGSEKQAFIASLQGRHVVLRETLYSVIDSDPNNPNIRYSPVKTTYISYGITVTSPNKGTFYRHRYGSAVNVDRDPQTLLAKIGRSRTTLTVHKAGTVLVIRPNRGVLFENDSLTVILIDELDNGGPAGVTTTLTVQWPQPFSTNFTERKEVEQLLEELLELQ